MLPLGGTSSVTRTTVYPKDSLKVMLFDKNILLKLTWLDVFEGLPWLLNVQISSK